MPKNIVIFSDGTGQDGGNRPEQVLSNVYKMYRVCRSGPDSSIRPNEQIAFYDAGLGTDIGVSGATSFIRNYRKLKGSVLGRGITLNIADCYEFLINHYKPGDRIFMVGFSRGAYTVRSLANLIRLCGIPTKTPHGPLPRFRKATRDIAEEAVTVVLEHGAGHPRADFEAERDEQARRFCDKYGSHHESGEALRSNAAPYFIGVFDTVAALGASGLKRLLIVGGIAVAVAVMLAVSGWVLGALLALVGAPFWNWYWTLGLVVLGGAYLIWNEWRGSKKTIMDFPNKDDVKTHYAVWKGDNFDRLLSRFVQFARSANAIDETRADFSRVGWGPPSGVPFEPIDGHDRLKQYWFAGNHSDVGGSYPEQESRLSDIELSPNFGDGRGRSGGGGCGLTVIRLGDDLNPVGE
ncbi:DUF2235 domain-containing protein, partial [Roseiarcaceae bacterium H3SJ34-1]|uniref:phospholipase effector Tle1 domain-containing protein n=1 Tax=Terripilifer ovatus TaxID=3032367 RepID=UPI003AB945C0|nr:DUF2235 domain-containing protein [Roseiarcaceae bacterium H3SJ34-1]